VKPAVEYDGAWHWKQRREDDRRRAALRELRWEVLVFDSHDVYADPIGMCGAVARARRARAA
jgi:very-short-patch-repair endonuclease